MKKIYIIYFFLFSIIITENIWCEKISSIEIKGNKNVPLSVIKSKIKTKKGDYFDSSSISKDIKELLSTEYFDNVEADFDTKTRKLIINLIERPFVEKIVFIGNKKISSKELKGILKIKEKDFLCSDIKDEIENIVEFYKSKGFVGTEVNYNYFVDTETNKCRIEYFVSEGYDEFKVNYVDVPPKYIDKLEKLLKLKNGKVYKIKDIENKLDKNKDKVINFYENEGFDDIEISTSVVYREVPDINIKIKYIEAPIIEKIELTGVKSFPERKIIELFGINKGMKYVKSKIKNGISRILEYYKDRGYAQVNVNFDVSSLDLSMSKINLKIEVNEGIKYKVRNISFESDVNMFMEKLPSIFGVKKNTLLIPKKVEIGCVNISKLYYDKLGLTVSCMPLINYYDDGTADILVKIENKIVTISDKSMLKQTYVGMIYVENKDLSSSKEYIIKRVINKEISEGMAFDSAIMKLPKVINDIKLLGFVKDIDVKFYPDYLDPKIIDIYFLIEEERPSEMSGGFFYRPWYGFGIHFGIKYHDLFSKGYKMDWENRYCPRDSDFSVSFSVPYFLKTKGDLTTKISYGWKNYCYVTKEIYDEFSVLYTPEISIKYVYPIFRDLFHFKVIYNYLKTKAEKIDAEIPYLQQQKNEICANNIVFSLSYFVDFEPFSKRIPHHSIDVSIDYCLYSDILGSDINVEKYEIYTNFCLPFLFNNILSITTDFSLNKTGDRTKQTPIFLRYFPGGLVKISGYDFWGQIGPPEGGDVDMVVSLRYVIPFSSSLPIVVTPFFEFGNAWRKTEDILWSFGTNDNMIKRSIGIGISYYGLIGIQYSHGLDAKQTEPSDFWYFGIAQPW